MNSSISVYERRENSDDGVELVLARGVRCKLREWDAPGYWTAYFSRLPKDVDIEAASIDQLVECETWAICSWVIAELYDGVDSMNRERIEEVIRDHRYWELKREIIKQAQARENFMPVAKKIADPCVPSSVNGKNGEGASRPRKKRGQTSNYNSPGAEKTENRLPA